MHPLPLALTISALLASSMVAATGWRQEAESVPAACSQGPPPQPAPWPGASGGAVVVLSLGCESFFLGGQTMLPAWAFHVTLGSVVPGDGCVVWVVAQRFGGTSTVSPEDCGPRSEGSSRVDAGVIAWWPALTQVEVTPVPTRGPLDAPAALDYIEFASVVRS